MSQPIVDVVTPPPLSPPSTSLRRTLSAASSELAGRSNFIASTFFTNGTTKTPASECTTTRGIQPQQRHGPAATQQRRQDDGGPPAPSYVAIDREEVKHGMPAQLQDAPSADFSVQTKPQDRDPSLMRAAAQAQMLTEEQKRLAREYNYKRRDKLMEEARQAALGSGNHDWIVLMDLARLASQHQLSPYSIMKFGYEGSPFAYVPITLQQPGTVDQTMRHQQESERWAIRWLMNKKRKLNANPEIRPESSSPHKLPNDEGLGEMASSTSSVGIKRPASVTTPTQDERARSLMRTEARPEQGVEESIKQAMADNLIGTSSACSSEESLALDDDVDPSLFDRSTRMMESKEGQADVEHDSVDSSTKHMGQLETAQEMLKTESDAGHEVTIAGPMDDEVVKVQDREKPIHIEQAGHPGSVAQHPQPVASMPPSQQAHLAMKTSDTHPIHISPIIPENLLKDISLKILPNVPSRFIGKPHVIGDMVKPAPSLMDPATHTRLQQSGERLIRLDNIVDLVAIAEPQGHGVLSQAQIADQAEAETAAVVASEESAPCIGNLLLSSCPGKKVRLTGPVRGRGAICRDLGLDLKRIHGLGIRAIICCLDDEELAFLGAPWPEYEMEADQLGLDVIRMPMAEGFAPSNVADMDAVITSMVMDYTLRGTSVLVHCRGGVGRAGLIACTWMLKMGLAGPDRRLQGVVEEPHIILNTVERLITTIRQRRSPKAIETAEQVKFIVEYVTYLHKQER